jgi:hypothetical protein
VCGGQNGAQIVAQSPQQAVLQSQAHESVLVSPLSNMTQLGYKELPTRNVSARFDQLQDCEQSRKYFIQSRIIIIIIKTTYPRFIVPRFINLAKDLRFAGHGVNHRE